PVSESRRRLLLHLKTEHIEELEGLEEFPRHNASGGVNARPRVRVAEEEARDVVLRLVHPDDLEAEYPGANLKARLPVDSVFCRVLWHRQAVPAREPCGEGRNLRAGIDEEGFRLPGSGGGLDVQVKLHAKKDVAGRIERAVSHRYFEA